MDGRMEQEGQVKGERKKIIREGLWAETANIKDPLRAIFWEPNRLEAS